MSIFYDAHARRPQVWTYMSFFVIAIGVFLAIYFYGLNKAKGMPVEVEKNTVFEETVQ